MKHIAKMLLLSAAFIAMGFAPLRADHRNDYGRNDYGRNDNGRDDYGRKAPRTVRLRDHDTRVVRSRRAPARHYRNSHKVRKHRRHYLTTRYKTRYHRHHDHRDVYYYDDHGHHYGHGHHGVSRLGYAHHIGHGGGHYRRRGRVFIGIGLHF